jgi:acetoin utilization protein AcuB
MKVVDVMTQDPLIAIPAGHAAHLMADRKIGCVPVVESGALVGLVTTTDVLRYVEGLD